MPTAVMSTAASGNFIGFLLAICGNTLIACSLTLQKRAHNTLSSTASSDSASSFDDPELPPERRRDPPSHSPSLSAPPHPPSALTPPPPPDAPLPPVPAPASPAPPPASPPPGLVVVDIHSPPSSPSRSRQALLGPPSPPSSLTLSPLPSQAAVTAGRHQLAFLLSPVWWVGTLLMAFGEVGNFAAFAFAPASLVAPLGAWSVVLSALLAHLFLDEAVTSGNLLGILLCVAGAVLIGTSAPSEPRLGDSQQLDAAAVMRLLVRAPFVCYILASLSVAAGLIYIAHRTSLARRHVCVYVGVSSVLGSVTVVCAKALSTFVRLTLEGASQFGSWLPFALAATLALAVLLQLRYLNMAMARFGNAQVIPVYYVLFTSCALMSGVVMYGEFDKLSLRNAPFFLGVCATMTGVFLVARSGTPSGAPGELDAPDEGQTEETTRTGVYGQGRWFGGGLGKAAAAACGFDRRRKAADEQAMQEDLSIIKLRELDDDDDGLCSSPLSSSRSSQVTL